MDYPERDYAKYNAYLPTYLEKVSTNSGNATFKITLADGEEKEYYTMWNCPACGSGTNEHHNTGALKLYYNDSTTDPNKPNKQPNTWSWYCFACRRGGDIYKLHMLAKKYKVMGQAYDDIEKMASDPTFKPEIAPDQMTKATVPEKKQVSDEDVKEYIYQCAKDIWYEPDALEYLHQRGLTDYSIAAFDMGFTNTYFDCKRRIVIPYNADRSYYGTRAIEPAEHSHVNCKKPMQIFYHENLNSGDDVVFVVESPLCAISIMQATQEKYHATAICGSHEDKLFDHMKQHPTKAVIALCFDQDEAGTKFTDEAMAAISDMGMRSMDVRKLFFTGANPDDPTFRKDPNEILQHDGEEALKAAVERAAAECRKLIPVEQPKEKETDMPEEIKGQEQAKQPENQPEQRTLESFLERIRSRKYEPVPTGIKAVDEALNGGFMRQQLIILGAAPSVGKTALTQWMFEGMAEQHNTPCLFLNLEMSADQLEARSISRIAARHGDHITDMQILKAYEADEPTWQKIQTAAREYYSQIAPRFYMRPAKLTSDLDKIIEYMELAAKNAHDKGEPAPFVCIDYLQLITSGNLEDSTVIKRAVAAFKNYAIQHNSVVLVIVAHNRQANSTGKLSMESGRDTSAIEYSADVQMGLTYTACIDERKKEPKVLTKDERRELTLQIFKGRFGGAGTDIKLYFDGETMTFLQDGVDFTPYKGNIPKELKSDKPLRVVSRK